MRSVKRRAVLVFGISTISAMYSFHISAQLTTSVLGSSSNSNVAPTTDTEIVSGADSLTDFTLHASDHDSSGAGISFTAMNPMVVSTVIGQQLPIDSQLKDAIKTIAISSQGGFSKKLSAMSSLSSPSMISSTNFSGKQSVVQSVSMPSQLPGEQTSNTQALTRKQYGQTGLQITNASESQIGVVPDRDENSANYGLSVTHISEHKRGSPMASYGSAKSSLGGFDPGLLTDANHSGAANSPFGDLNSSSFLMPNIFAKRSIPSSIGKNGKSNRLSNRSGALQKNKLRSMKSVSGLMDRPTKSKLFSSRKIDKTNTWHNPILEKMESQAR